jgi:O-6-methylguanine DNA methyltransferase
MNRPLPTSRSTTDPLSDPVIEADIEKALDDLGVDAPAGLADRTLVAVGLADAYGPLETVIGPIWVAFNGLGVSALESAQSGPAFEARFRASHGRPAHRLAELPPRLTAAIQRRLDGDRRVSIPLDLRGHSTFEKDVWLKALEIPRGEVRPYGWIAAEIGRPKAVRAVGTALGHNPVPLVVPCHRVVRTDGMLGQYSLGGPANKRALLASEGLDPDGLEGLARSGVRYIGSDTTRIYCLPTCHNAKRITARHRSSFRSAAAAASAGYRACLECRPAVAA